MRNISYSQLSNYIGEELGLSNWKLIAQDTIDLFAEVSGDHQWIHVDPERAAKGPYRTTVAHGLLALAIAPSLANQVYTVDGVDLVVNYGLNKVRFPSPLPSSTRVRNRVKLISVTDVSQGKQMVVQHTLEREDHDRPVCVADQVRLLIPAQQ